MFQFSEARKRDLVPQLFFIESSVGPLHLTEQSLQSLAHAPRARTRQKSLDRRYSLARAPRARLTLRVGGKRTFKMTRFFALVTAYGRPRRPKGLRDRNYD